MKAERRQRFLIGVAIFCVVTVGFRLLFSSDPEKPVPIVPPPAQQQVPSTAPIESVPVGIPTEFYQRLRQQLQQMVPERAEPFKRPEGSLRSSSTPSLPSTMQHASRNLQPSPTLPPLIMEEARRPPNESLSPAPSVFRLVPFANEPEGSTNRRAQQTSVRIAEGTGSEPTPEQTQQTNETVPRLRGIVQDPKTGKAQVALEWNGKIVIATTDPQAEWQLIKLSNEIVQVRNGKHEYTLRR